VPLIERKLIFRRVAWVVFTALIAAFESGCAVSQKTAVKSSTAPMPLKTATKDQLVAQLNGSANAIISLNASVTIKLSAGSAYTGVIEQYHEVNGFILAQRPMSIRLIGQAPIVDKNIFDMESDGETFRIFIPSKNQFMVGPANLERPSVKPIENLRPQHLIDAIFWQSIPESDPVLFEEANEARASYYVLTAVRRSRTGGTSEEGATGPTDWEIARKIWFDRADLNIVRIEAYDPAGKLNSDVRYSGWDTFGTTRYARQILLLRPANDYQLQLGITKLAVNEPIEADRFELSQPPGTELVRVGGDAREPQP
jgi:outer membrane lipoprotein-sorting protein